MMTDYPFTLKFALPESADPASHVEKLAACGCDDALIGIGKVGRIALDFNRSATSANEAVLSALRDVRKAIPGAKFIEAVPDLVGLSDGAELAGCSRQNMRKITTSDFDFPTAVHDGNPGLFHLVEVLAWLAQSKQEPIDRVLLEVARTNREVNLAKQIRTLPNQRVSREILDGCEA